MARSITESYLLNAARYYLLRWPASTANLQRFLQRRIAKHSEGNAEVMATAQTLLAPVIQILQAEGSLNDVRYGQDLASRLQQQGKPLKVIAGQLQAKGLAASVVKDALQQVQGAALVDGGADLLAARAYVARRRLGFWRGDAACDYMQKDMGALARRGFSYQTAKRALQRTEIE